MKKSKHGKQILAEWPRNSGTQENLENRVLCGFSLSATLDCMCKGNYTKMNMLRFSSWSFFKNLNSFRQEVAISQRHILVLLRGEGLNLFSFLELFPRFLFVKCFILSYSHSWWCSNFPISLDPLSFGLPLFIFGYICAFCFFSIFPVAHLKSTISP